MINIKYSQFFDRPRVMKKVKDGTASVLAKAGAHIMTRAKRSIRPRKGSAKPGNPPFSHEGNLRDLIFFGYEKKTDSVVVGPKLSKGGNPTIPQALEFGGTLTHWRTKKATRYHAFPYMAPALTAEVPNFPELFSGAIRGND